jgi:hypothetical protein
MKMPGWLNQIITEPDNRTVCIVRIMSIVGAGEFFALAAKTALKSGTFDMQSFGIGFGTLLGGIGAALKLKKDSPDNKT